VFEHENKVKMQKLEHSQIGFLVGFY